MVNKGLLVDLFYKLRSQTTSYFLGYVVEHLVVLTLENNNGNVSPQDRSLRVTKHTTVLVTEDRSVIQSLL